MLLLKLYSMIRYFEFMWSRFFEKGKSEYHFDRVTSNVVTSASM